MKIEERIYRITLVYFNYEIEHSPWATLGTVIDSFEQNNLCLKIYLEDEVADDIDVLDDIYNDAKNLVFLYGRDMPLIDIRLAEIKFHES